MAIPDMLTFSSRLHYKGNLLFTTAHRIGAERSLDVTAPDLPVLRTADGRPYIPGSSFKGAWRAYTEAILRTVQAQAQLGERLACDPLSHTDNCLPQERVTEIKQRYQDDQPRLDETLRAESCWTCRVFGNGHLAAKVLIKDLNVQPKTFYRTEVRDGVAIDRDSGRAADGMLYGVETVPAGAVFTLEIMIENASPAELGLAMLGLLAFQRGEILLGGAKSRGLGWCELHPLWDQSDYVTPENLLAYALRPAETNPAGVADDIYRSWLAAFETAVQNGEV
jgi:CRISPR-associated RAMP protein (TIGR02581 family)